MRPSRRVAFAVFAAASLSLHLALVALVPRASRPPRATPASLRQLELQWLELQWLEVVAPVEAKLVQPAPSVVAPDRTARRVSRSQARVVAVPPEPRAALVADVPEPVEAQEQPRASAVVVNDAPAAPPGSPLDLSPAAVAAGLLEREGTRCGAADGRELAAACVEHGPAAGATDVDIHEARLQQALRAAAADRPHVRRRPDPELERQVDGSYAYQGHAFSATIARDGSVHFEDRPAVTAELQPTFEFLRFNFDIGDLIEGSLVGNTLYAAEKQHFLDRTETLRRELAEVDWQARRQRGLRTLRGQLVGIVDNEAATTAERRLAVFALWNDCSDDELGSEAQRLIEDFIRERMGQGTALGYSAVELAELNARRHGRREFAPYRRG
ncbi:MAG: hypothetical protein OEZ06_31055 [Myxococcales bacterium]|nr:hypothetical protein [Myxococcales bacterium]